MRDKKTYYNLRYDVEQLEIIIKALDEAESYYNNYLYDVYENFEELAEIIKGLNNIFYKQGKRRKLP
ncbi:hypothetical protein GUI37_06080 [Helcococcus kunzii]|uniref:hypothetical protein n=1 Tax=Helcococcus kunzii TaxID=40091 RepID=UPI001BAF4F5B|nr:hypothetical protein [Helcococcus kunzii]QUY65108.1 hypothetical protein GUI37_06080 [Helcococcus kunzii]